MPICLDHNPAYRPHTKGGLNFAGCQDDGYTIAIEWDKAYVSSSDYNLAYNIYYSTIKDDVFSEGVKYVSVDDGYLNVCLTQFTPGDTYYFAVRATEYELAIMNLALLPDGITDLKVYPETVLLSDMSISDLTMQIDDINEFPAFGVILVGTELIRYTSKDIPNNELLIAERGYLGTNVRFHQTDGYDGVANQDPIITFWKGFEEQNEHIILETANFFKPNHARTDADGYKSQTEDLLTTDLSASDENQSDFPSYDYVGWHRTDPIDLLRGNCIGTYYGGEQFCADGYLGVGRQLRGVPFQDQNARRQEVLLGLTGESCVLVRRLWKGIRCSCYKSTTEFPQDRCPHCFSTGFITGYQQFFNQRRSDGRILVRFNPSKDDLKFQENGLESEFIPECWTMVFPAVKDRDFIIRFNEDGTEEFRYEILDVTRNKLLEGFSGRQSFTAKRVRKTDPIYQWRAIRSTATMPTTITTTIGMVSGPGGIPPHTHNIVINENIVSLSQINQTTSLSSDSSNSHNHVVINGIVQEALGHSHTIVL